MPATDEQKAVISVLLLLLRRGEDWRLRQQLGTVRHALRVAEGKFTPYSKSELERRMLYSGRCGKLNADSVIFIEPPEREKSAVAALWCRWDFSDSVAKCGFFLGMWSRPAGALGSAENTANRQPVFLGFRFETPEQNNTHNFYHVQPCRSMVGGGSSLTESLPISERNPTWPLAAKSALELLLCLVISLYGLSGLMEIEKEIEQDPDTRAQDVLLRAVREMQALGRNQSQ